MGYALKAALGRAPQLSRAYLMSDDIVVLETFGNEVEARLAAAILEANGIPTEVLADTAGGALPSMALVFPVRLLVRSEDAALAHEILHTSVEPSPESDDQAP